MEETDMLAIENRQEIPAISVTAETLPEAWEKAVIAVWNHGAQIKTQYDKDGDHPSKDATVMVTVKAPFAEPRIHKNFPGGPAELEYIDPQASKLLENAKAFMKIGTRFTTPKQGVELCRRIIREYPDTTYAIQARELLRGLPERHQKRYKITDEEMGL